MLCQTKPKKFWHKCEELIKYATLFAQVSTYVLYLSIYIKLKSCLSVCLSDGHAAYSPDLARIDIVCADNEALIIRLL